MSQANAHGNRIALKLLVIPMATLALLAAALPAWGEGSPEGDTLTEERLETVVDANDSDTTAPENAGEEQGDAQAGEQDGTDADGQPDPADQASGSEVPSDTPSDTDLAVDVLEGTHPDGWSTSKDGSISYYYVDGQPYTGWVVDSHLAAYGERRYWVTDGVLAQARVITPDDGPDAYWAYATAEGFVATGAYATTNARDERVVYLADSTGHLVTETGWLDSKAFGQGQHRYYVEKDDSTGACLVRVGYSTKGYPHFTTAAGYVVVGAKKANGHIYVASSTGRMPVLAADANGVRPKQGWLTTDSLGQGSQRYYLYQLESGAYVAKPGFSKDGYPHYTTSKGYVLRGALRSGSKVIVADKSTGRMPSKAGWVKTSQYGQGKRRYYFVKQTNGSFVACIGMSTKGYRHYTTKKGYVQTSGYVTIKNVTYIASIKGRLIKAPKISIERDIRKSLIHGPKGAKYQRYIVLHDTEGVSSARNIIDGWVAAGKGVAAHFIVGRDGSVVQCVPMDKIAHHAGFGDNGHNKKYGISESSRDDRRGTTPIGSWATNYGMNAWSIGIEMVHVGNQSYTSAQLRALDGLIAHIDARSGTNSKIIDHKAWRSYNSDTSPAFAGYLRNYQRTRTHDGSKR